MIYRPYIGFHKLSKPLRNKGFWPSPKVVFNQIPKVLQTLTKQRVLAILAGAPKVVFNEIPKVLQTLMKQRILALLAGDPKAVFNQIPKVLQTLMKQRVFGHPGWSRMIIIQKLSKPL